MQAKNTNITNIKPRCMSYKISEILLVEKIWGFTVFHGLWTHEDMLNMIILIRYLSETNFYTDLFPLYICLVSFWA